ncbi:MAG: PAS domain S-box protein [Leptospiraceae bacterium]|nr:PAS domain S-box protein [Leptospiraceae bacterium]
MNSEKKNSEIHFFGSQNKEIKLKEIIFPSLFQNLWDKEIRIWLPFCDTGEVAYSLAILILDYFKEKQISNHVQIIATDPNPESIDFAINGIYETSDMENFPSSQFNYFTKQGENQFQVLPLLRNLIHFSHKPILETKTFKNIDFLDCENIERVTNQNVKENFLKILSNSLSAGSFLFLPEDCYEFEFLLRQRTSNSKWENTFFEDIWKYFPHPILLMDKDFQILTSNRQYVEKFQNLSNQKRNFSEEDFPNTYLEDGARFSPKEFIQAFQSDILLKEHRLLVNHLSSDGNPDWYLWTIQKISMDNFLIIISEHNDIKQLRDENLQWIEIFNHYPWGIALGKPDEEYIYKINPAFAEVLGYSINEMKGLPIKNIFSKSEVESIHTIIQKIQTEGSLMSERKVIKKDGSEITVFMSSKAIRDSNGKLIYRLSGILDLSQQKKIERDLLEAKLRFESAFRNLSVPKLIVNADTMEILETNRAFVTLTGYELKELYDKNLNEIPLFSKNNFLETISSDSIQLGKSIFSEVEIQTKHGKKLNIMFSLAKIIWEEKRSLLLALIDITDRKEAELKLRESEEKYRVLVNSIDSLIIIFDKDGRYLYANDLTFKVLNLEKDKVIGRSMFEIFPKEIANRQVESIKEVIRDRKPIVVVRESVVVGITKWFRSSLSPIFDSNGEVHTVMATITEVNDLKTNELKLQDLNHQLNENNQLIQSMNGELERANHAKDNFFAHMSHELRTPLNSILLLSESLMDRYIGPLNNKQMEALSIVSKSGNHLLSLINDILDISKMETGEERLRIRKLEIKNVCENSISIIQHLAHKKQISFSVTFGFQSENIFADEKLLKQILINLLNNAIKFTPLGGKVDFQIDVDKEKDLAYFIIRDTGIGISEENQKLLFKPFVQIKKDISEVTEGTGLGLAIVSKYASLHKGKISMKSVLNEGSEFILELPLGRSKEKNQTEDKSWNDIQSIDKKDLNHDNHSFTPSPNLLIVEDDPSNIYTLSLFLESRNFRFEVAKDGNTALEMIKKFQPDVILLDILLPHMNGIDVISYVRNYMDNEIRKIPIIVMSALLKEIYMEKALEEGADIYLSKPLNLNELSIQIYQLLEKKNAK